MIIKDLLELGGVGRDTWNSCVRRGNATFASQLGSPNSAQRNRFGPSDALAMVAFCRLIQIGLPPSLVDQAVCASLDDIRALATGRAGSLRNSRCGFFADPECLGCFSFYGGTAEVNNINVSTATAYIDLRGVWTSLSLLIEDLD
jgi:hypothetical protein